MPDVLVVDDNKAFRHTLKGFLEDEGYTVYVSPDGQTALDFLRSHAIPLVVLLDWQMPGLDGIQVLYMVAEDSLLAQRHAFIAMTAAANIDTVALPPNLEVQFLSKLCRLDDIQSLVGKAAAVLALRGV
jgi:CheY-like chemotaxis protein